MSSFYSGYLLPDDFAFDQIKQFDYLARFVDEVSANHGRSDLPAIEPDRDVLALWPVRDQGNKPTCVAFAAAAGVEYVLARGKQAPEWLSTHFLYYNMRTGHDQITMPPENYGKGATLLEQAGSVLADDGVCTEGAAPYSASGICEVSADGKFVIEGTSPSAEAYRLASEHTLSKLGLRVQHERFPDGAPFGNNFAARFHQALLNNASVAIGIPIFPTVELGSVSNLETAEAVTEGVVRGPGEPGSKVLPGVKPIAGHAVCLVGFHPDDSYPELNGGWFVFRNSAGTISFASSVYKSPFGVPRPGYGAISAAYVAAYCHEYLIIGS